MIQHLLLLLAPEHTVVQASFQEPLAVPKFVHKLGFIASVEGNAVGFATIMMFCWCTLLFMQSFL